MKTNNVHIDFIVPGDTIIHNGDMKTVCQKDIREGGFFGKTIFGDSYNMGTKLVTVVLFK